MRETASPTGCPTRASENTGGNAVRYGATFGMCVDRFGVQWMVSLPNPV